MSAEHIKALTYITYIGCIISIVCLFIAWLTFQFCKWVITFLEIAGKNNY